MKLTLDDRLRACLNEVKGSKCVCDVGSDHGKLAVAAIVEEFAECAIATDISRASLIKAELLADRCGLCLATRVGDGLKVIGENEADTVVIAGMGGYEIVRILKEAPHRYPKYVLVPHRHAVEVRKYIKANNAGIIRDYLVKVGGHYYPIISFSYSVPWNTKHNIYAGEDEPCFREYRKGRLKLIDSWLECAEDAKAAVLKDEREVLISYGDRK